MDAAAKVGVPVVIAPGCLEMVNFGERDSVPEQFSERKFYIHNPQVTLMRTTAAESADLSRILAGKANSYAGPAAFMIPRKAISVISAAGQPFHDPAADEALFSAIRSLSKVAVEEWDEEINSPVFAAACARKLLAFLAI